MFWVGMVLGVMIGWKLKGFFGNKLSFLGKLKKPFSRKKKMQETEDGEEQGVVKRTINWFSRPIEKWMGDDKKGGKK